LPFDGLTVPSFVEGRIADWRKAVRSRLLPFAICHLPLFIFSLLFSTIAFGATDNGATPLDTALEAQDELAAAIQKTAASFVFIGGGSGVVLSPDGYILTNYHVAGDRKQWTVRINGQSKLYVCDLAGLDPVGDLALLKCRDAKNLPCIEWGDAGKISVGQQVLAVGDPFRLSESEGPPAFSLGTISALHRFQGNYCDAIQTDSAINPGNSGGPLLTLDGKLIGITGQIMTRFGAKSNTGIAYAIPVDQIQRFYQLLKEAKGQAVYHGTLPDGMTFISLLDETQMAQVDTVEQNSPAAAAGFQPGDRILYVDGKRIYNYHRLVGIVRSYPEAAVLDVTTERRSQIVTLKLKLPRQSLPACPPKSVEVEKK
jgi:serine protease Do